MRDDRGIVLSTELVSVAVVAVFGMIVVLAATRDAVISELSDTAGAVQDFTQCYELAGINGHSSQSHGMGFTDATDFCDDPEDPAGGADNCITFDAPPTDTVSTDDQAVKLNFDDGTADDSSPFGNSNDGTLIGDATISGGSLELDGDGDGLFLGNSNDINLGIQQQRTISLDFIADEVTSRQVLFEEGAGTRGLVIYIDNGLLYIGGWNRPDAESDWEPVFFSTPITAGTLNSVTLVLDGDATVQPGALTGYLNGAQFGSAAGSQLWSHGGGIGIGNTNGNTLFHDGASGNGDFSFGGQIDNFCLYNRTLTADEVATADNRSGGSNEQ